MSGLLRSRATIAAAVATAAALALAALTLLPTTASNAGTEHGDNDSKLETQLAAARKASVKYQDVQAAIDDGYHPPEPYVCVDSDAGTMGHHYLKWDRLDTKLDIEKPELMLYAPGDDGKLQLVAVEYMVPDADQDLSTDDDRPTLFGKPFDGPMEGHELGMPIHYDLHVWVWSENPSGTFAPWNPEVSC